MSDFRGGGGSKMTPKNRIIEGKNRIKGGRGGQKWPKKSDIIYACSLTQATLLANFGIFQQKPAELSILIIWLALAESELSVNSEETYNNEELDDNSNQNSNNRNYKSKKYKLLKFISKHTLNILYGILGSIVASALTGAIYSIVNITGTGIEMTNKPTNNNLTINSGTRAKYLSMRVYIKCSWD